MKRNLVWIAVLALGCGKKKEEAPPAPFTGALTAERILASKDTVKLLEPWDRAYAKLQAQLGTPQKIDGKKHVWAVADATGDSCTYVTVESDDGKQYGKQGTVVGALYEPMTIAKDGPIMNRAECLDATGFEATPEDPAAAGPPASGTVPIADVEKLAVAGRSKWKDQRIQVAGTAQNLMGDELQLSGATATGLAMKTPPSADLLGKDIVAACTVKLERSLRGDGTYRWSAKLADCELVDTPASN